MAITNKPWDGSASKYPDTDAYCAACLIDDNPAGKDKVQALCKLPIKEPNGDINSNALPAALGALNGARNALKGVSTSNKKKAARALMRAYHLAQMDVPQTLKDLAM